MTTVIKGLFLFSLIVLGGCSSDREGSSNGNALQNQKVSTEKALQTFNVDQFFWRAVKKSEFDGGRIISLVHSKVSPSASISTELVAYNLEGKHEPLPKLPKGFVPLDFSVTANGHIVQIAFSELAESDQDFGLPLKEVSVFEGSQKLFVFKDSKLNQAVQYAADGTASPSRPFDSNRTLFLTSSPWTMFARVKATDTRIYISAFGTFGYKIFAFDRSGSELSQVEVLPKTDFNTFLIDEEAPFIEMNGDVLAAVITTPREDAPLIRRHLGIDLNWQGPRYQAVVQTFNGQLVRRGTVLAKGEGNFFASGLSCSLESIAVFGDSGGAGKRNGLAVVYDTALQSSVQSEFSIEGETSLYGAVFLKNQLVVAGSTGSAQVSTGSVVVPSDAFVAAIDLTNGTSQLLARFGTDRHDRITSVFKVNDDLYVSGNSNGPITHTSDSDPSLGYQEWFLGRLKR